MKLASSYLVILWSCLGFGQLGYAGWNLVPAQIVQSEDGEQVVFHRTCATQRIGLFLKIETSRYVKVFGAIKESGLQCLRASQVVTVKMPQLDKKINKMAGWSVLGDGITRKPELISLNHASKSKTRKRCSGVLLKYDESEQTYKVSAANLYGESPCRLSGKWSKKLFAKRSDWQIDKSHLGEEPRGRLVIKRVKKLKQKTGEVIVRLRCDEAPVGLILKPERGRWRVAHLVRRYEGFLCEDSKLMSYTIAKISRFQSFSRHEIPSRWKLRDKPNEDWHPWAILIRARNGQGGRSEGVRHSERSEGFRHSERSGGFRHSERSGGFRHSERSGGFRHSERSEESQFRVGRDPSPPSGVLDDGKVRVRHSERSEESQFRAGRDPSPPSGVLDDGRARSRVLDDRRALSGVPDDRKVILATWLWSPKITGYRRSDLPKFLKFVGIQGPLGKLELSP